MCKKCPHNNCIPIDINYPASISLRCVDCGNEFKLKDLSIIESITYKAGDPNTYTIDMSKEHKGFLSRFKGGILNGK